MIDIDLRPFFAFLIAIGFVAGVIIAALVWLFWNYLPAISLSFN